MMVGGMDDFVCDDSGEFVVGLDVIKEPTVDVDAASRQAKRVDVFVLNDVECLLEWRDFRCAVDRGEFLLVGYGRDFASDLAHMSKIGGVIAELVLLGYARRSLLPHLHFVFSQGQFRLGIQSCARSQGEDNNDRQYDSLKKLFHLVQSPLCGGPYAGIIHHS